MGRRDRPTSVRHNRVDVGNQALRSSHRVFEAPAVPLNHLTVDPLLDEILCLHSTALGENLGVQNSALEVRQAIAGLAALPRVMPAEVHALQKSVGHRQLFRPSSLPNRLPALVARRQENAAQSAPRDVKTDVTQARRQLEPAVRDGMTNLLLRAQAAGVRLLDGGTRTKTVDSMTAKLGGGRTLDEVSDLVATRLVVPNLAALERGMAFIEKDLGQSLLRKKNKFIDNAGTDKPYGAVHYVVQIGALGCFEIQLKTQAMALCADLEHPVVYKGHLLNMSQPHRERVLQLNWSVRYHELQAYAEVSS